MPTRFKIQRLDNKNATIIQKSNGDVILFSYTTPVAAIIKGKSYVTRQKWSVTTSRHINRFFGSKQSAGKAEAKPQEWFDKLM